MRFVWMLTVILAAHPALGESDNSLWANLYKCKDFSTECIKNTFRAYLDETFSSGDLEVSSFLRFTKNDLDANAIARNSTKTRDNEAEQIKLATSSSSRAVTPLEEVAQTVQDKAKEFLYTHDIELSLPEFISGEGAVVRISPRALQEDGSALVSLDLAAQRRSHSKDVGSPRLFKKIRKFIGERLMWALAALILVVKLLSMKFMFFLPVIMGVAAAKKLLLKVILFVFPFLGHLFKLCPYYSPTKYHHHQHQISHLHHVPHLHSLHAGGIELDHPPPGWHEHHEHHDHHDHHHIEHLGEHHDDFSYYTDGPSYSAHESLRRKTHKDPPEDDDYVGQGQPAAPYVKPYPSIRKSPIGPPSSGPPSSPGKLKAGPLSVAEIENLILKAEKEAMLKARLQEEQKRVELENKRLQDKIKTSLKFQEKLKIQSQVAKQTSKLAAAYQAQSSAVGPPPSSIFTPPQMLQPVIAHTQAIYPAPLQHQVPPPPPLAIPASSSSGSAFYNNLPGVNTLVAMQTQLQNGANGNENQRHSMTSARISNDQMKSTSIVDPFYSPILAKIDNVFNELTVMDEACRERLVCNMYSEPEKYSPHSNLLSAELSRDASELEKPTSSNPAVIRFYKYVQAARDGQDKRDCSTLYPACSASF